MRSYGSVTGEKREGIWVVRAESHPLRPQQGREKKKKQNGGILGVIGYVGGEGSTLEVNNRS